MDLLQAAREAGASGKSWHDWSMSDEAQDEFAKVDLTREQQDAIEAAFAEGARGHLSATGKVVWTTAPKDYDGGTTVELEVLGDYHGRPLRKVAMASEDFDWQTGRYASGTYGEWDTDPREEDRRVREAGEKHKAEMAAVDARRQAGRDWLRTATAAELADEDLAWEKGATWKDVREEKQRRHEEAAGAARSEGWAKVNSTIVEGATYIDDGGVIHAEVAGLRPVVRHARIYYDVRIQHGWPDDVDHAKITAANERGRGTDEVADVPTFMKWIEKGWVHPPSGDVPPQAVAARIGYDRWKDIVRVEVGKKTVWIGRATFGGENLILDENGRLVRAKKTVEAAEAAYDAHEQAKYRTAAETVKGHAHGGALRRRHSGVRFRSRGAVKVHGTSTDVTTCGHCGKKGLDSTVVLSVAGGTPMNYGAECARRVLRGR